MRIAAFILCLLSVIAFAVCGIFLICASAAFLSGALVPVENPSPEAAVYAVTGVIFSAMGLIMGIAMLVPLIYGIPMTVFCFKACKGTYDPSTGFSVCLLVFFNLIAGILLLADAGERKAKAPENID